MWVRPILISCTTYCSSTVLSLLMKSRKSQAVNPWIRRIYSIDWNIASLNEWENKYLEFFWRFRYIPWVVVDSVVFRGSCYYLQDLDRHFIQILLILSVWFPVNKIIDILGFHFLEFDSNRYNSTSKVYKMSNGDIEFLTYTFHCILVGLILNKISS